MMTDFGNKRWRVPIAKMTTADNMKWMGYCVEVGSMMMWRPLVDKVVVVDNKR